MRAPVDAGRLRAFLEELSHAARESTRLYLTGGASQLLRGLRDSTVDIDLTFEPEDDGLLKSMVGLKEKLSLNVEIVSPAHFVPPLPGWLDRSEFALQVGRLAVFHFDPYTQVLAKLEHGHARDLEDIRALVDGGIVDPARLRSLFAEVQTDLFRYPSIDPKSLAAAVDRLATNGGGSGTR